ncbi:OmpA family protein [Steroidobacter agaridevorans]|uniref:OmpA family protein n=1 Tax=Steroidobacter agaridevorans TaxID=2695856 RepID=UPI001322C6CF|nr:OmpA family protein [Steroidobacter agaridevorans]GFE91705.1 membrane protein [Steroidobacter agaridevorans]
MFKKVLVTAVALAMSAGAAQAGEKNKLTKEEGVGMFSGAAAGAIVGGPIGAAVGFMFGGILGDSVGTANRAQLQAKQMEEQSQKLEQELIDTRIALAKASERTGGDEMLDALAQRLHADVLFRTNDATMEADVASKLEDLGKLLALHGELEVQLHGFADPRGKSEKNLELSLERANAVREALIRGGAAPEQIQLSAHGSDLTTAPKGDLEAYAWERRVSLSIRPTATSAVARNE